MPVINYTVTSANTDEVTVEAVVAGQTVQAKVNRVVVEATSADGSMGHTFRLGADADVADFPVGSTFTATLTPDA